MSKNIPISNKENIEHKDIFENLMVNYRQAYHDSVSHTALIVFQTHTMPLNKFDYMN